MVDFFDKDKIYFFDVDKKDEGYLTRSKRSIECNLDPNAKHIAGSSFIMVTKDNSQFKPLLCFPSGLDMSSQRVSVIEGIKLEDAMQETFIEAMSINETSIIVTDREEFEDFLYISHGRIVPIGEEEAIPGYERLVVYHGKNAYEGEYVLPNGDILFKMSDTDKEILFENAAFYRFLIECYSKLDNDECLGIEKKDGGGFVLMAAKIVDGEIVLRELDDMFTGEVLMSPCVDINMFYIHAGRFMGYAQENKSYSFNLGIKDKGNLTDCFFEWVSDMEELLGTSKFVFSRNPEMQECIDRLSKAKISLSTRDIEP